jgi:hypothetical protein
MFRKFSPILLALMLFAIAIAPVAAQSGTGDPIADTYVSTQAPTTNYDGNDLRIEGSSGPGGGCSAVRTVYMKWDLSTHNTPISNAVVVLTTTNVTSNAQGQTLRLSRVDNDNWTEGMTYNSGRPDVGTEVATYVLGANPPATGTKIIFDAPGITTFVNEQIAGDKVASFALTFATCAASSLQAFDDIESGTTVGPSLEAPLAVGMTEVSAQQATSWPLYAGLAAVALVVVAGVAISRRRTA